MHGNLKRLPTPEERELERKRTELAALEAELFSRELELSTYQADLRAFETLYVRTVGSRYAVLDEIEARIAEEEARRRPSDQQAKDRATQARKRSKESSAATGGGTTADQPAFIPSDSLKALFREVVKRLHPDLTTDEDERTRRHVLMAEANCAYSEGNEAKLRALLDGAEAHPEVVLGDGVGAELVRIIRKIAQVEARLERIARELAELREFDFWNLKLTVESAELAGRDILAEMAASVDARITAAQCKLSLMINKDSV